MAEIPRTAVLALALLAACSAPSAPDPPDLTGTWTGEVAWLYAPTDTEPATLTLIEEPGGVRGIAAIGSSAWTAKGIRDGDRIRLVSSGEILWDLTHDGDDLWGTWIRGVGEVVQVRGVRLWRVEP